MYWRTFKDLNLLKDREYLQMKFPGKGILGILTSKNKDFPGYFFFDLENSDMGLVTEIEVTYNDDYGETIYPQKEDRTSEWLCSWIVEP